MPETIIDGFMENRTAQVPSTSKPASFTKSGRAQITRSRPLVAGVTVDAAPRFHRGSLLLYFTTNGTSPMVGGAYRVMLRSIGASTVCEKDTVKARVFNSVEANGRAVEVSSCHTDYSVCRYGDSLPAPSPMGAMEGFSNAEYRDHAADLSGFKVGGRRFHFCSGNHVEPGDISSRSQARCASSIGVTLQGPSAPAGDNGQMRFTHHGGRESDVVGTMRTKGNGRAGRFGFSLVYYGKEDQDEAKNCAQGRASGSAGADPGWAAASDCDSKVGGSGGVFGKTQSIPTPERGGGNPWLRLVLKNPSLRRCAARRSRRSAAV